MMIGREYSHVFPPKPPRRRQRRARRCSRSRNLCWADRLQRHLLRVRPGEVVGLGGLDGQGQRELLLALFGVLRGVTGEIRIDGKPVRLHSPRAAKSARSAWR